MGEAKQKVRQIDKVVSGIYIAVLIKKQSLKTVKVGLMTDGWKVIAPWEYTLNEQSAQGYFHLMKNMNYG